MKGGENMSEFHEKIESDGWLEDNVAEPIAEKEGEFEGTIILSTDGKQSVIAKATTKEGRASALKWTKTVYDRLSFTYGSKQAYATKEYKEAESGLGKCEKCSAPNLLSKAGKPYCSKKCWLS